MTCCEGNGLQEFHLRCLQRGRGAQWHTGRQATVPGPREGPGLLTEVQSRQVRRYRLLTGQGNARDARFQGCCHCLLVGRSQKIICGEPGCWLWRTIQQLLGHRGDAHLCVNAVVPASSLCEHLLCTRPELFLEGSIGHPHKANRQANGLLDVEDVFLHQFPDLLRLHRLRAGPSSLQELPRQRHGDEELGQRLRRHQPVPDLL
mmetsp:Transcript_12256/g.20186  ORF Transcript_12256/g.20186 Transcript_12256/m.20186 type:complete len:204 (+) Transcript_12256:869-1480(+)